MNNNAHLLIVVCLVYFFGAIIKPTAWAGGGAGLENAQGEHEFLTACKKGDDESVRNFLDLDGFDINQLYSSGENKPPCTGLYLAAGHGHNDAVKMLLGAGADPNISNPDGKTPLIIAATFGHQPVINILIDFGADVNAVTDNNDSAIYMASKGGHDQLVKRLMVAGAIHPMGDASKPVLKNTGEEHDFLAACREGHIAGVRYYLRLAEFDINQLFLANENKQPTTGLYLAAGFGHSSVVKMLLEAGADPNRRTHRGWTPFFNTVALGRQAVINTLIDFGADVNAVTDNNDSAIYMASKGGHDQLVKRLMVAGAIHPMGDASKPVLKNTGEEHDFLAACREGHIAGVRYYLRLAEFDINQLFLANERKQPTTGLYLAAGFGHHSVVKMLLEAGADPNRRTHRGWTPFLNTVAFGRQAVINTLIDFGADVNAVTDNNDSAIYMASKGGHDQLVKRLMVAGAIHPMGDASKPVLKNTGEEHDFLAACREGHIAGVRYYLRLAEFDINQLFLANEKKQPTTGLYLAAGFGHHSVVKMLLEAGADPNRRTHRGWTPFLNAAALGRQAVINTLIDFGADVNAVTDDNDSAIYMASKGGHDQLVKRLMVAGAIHPMGDASKPVLKNTGEEHDFLAACREGHIPGVRYYLRLAEFDINQLFLANEKKQPTTGLYLAAGSGHHSVVKMLLEAGADPNVEVYSGNTPLINAATGGYEAVVNTLIENGADTQHASDSGLTALSEAAKNGYYKIVSMLLENGVDPYNRIQGKYVGKKALSEASTYQPGFSHTRPLLTTQNYAFTKEVLSQTMKARDHGEVRSWRSQLQHAGGRLYKNLINFSRGGSADERQSLIDPMAKLSVHGK